MTPANYRSSLLIAAETVRNDVSVFNAGLNIDPDSVSVSGISAGGSMAQQYHVAYSSEVVGVGVFAAGACHVVIHRLLHDASGYAVT